MDSEKVLSDKVPGHFLTLSIVHSLPVDAL